MHFDLVIFLTSFYMPIFILYEISDENVSFKFGEMKREGEWIKVPVVLIKGNLPMTNCSISFFVEALDQLLAASYFPFRLTSARMAE